MSAAASPSPTDAPTGQPRLQKGATIGRYVVLGLIGRGAMGEVYAAYDPELDRKIAVKLLRSSGADSPDSRTRLLREAQAIARLSDPHVVVVYDVGTFEDMVFIAMEFVDGHTLGYWREAQGRTWREALAVYVSAGRGLAAAHAAGLVHRDFKPDNVMITASGQVRVMDFGLARELIDERSPANKHAEIAEANALAIAETFSSDADPDSTAKLGKDAAPPTASGRYLSVKLTQTGAILGTPAYMAPEQFAGAGGDAQADQFSFCVALYEAVYGTRPFAGNNVVELMANVVGGKLSDPPEGARVPARIRRALLRGLSMRPADRWPSMDALLAALTHDAAVRRRQWVVAGATCLAVVGAVGASQRLSPSRPAMCTGGPERAAAVWGPDRRDAIRRAFMASGSPSAPTAFARMSEIFDGYLRRWTEMYEESCKATHVRGEQSNEVLDLRTECLGERLSAARALSDVFASANASTVDNAVTAASALPALDRCADVAMLRAVIKPPSDPAVRARVAEVREQASRVRALASAGRCDEAETAANPARDAARAIGYRPLEAEVLIAMARLGDECLEPRIAATRFEEAAYAAEASHHDEIAIDAASDAAGIYADRLHDSTLARHWLRHAEATLERLPNHPVQEAWVAVARGLVLMREARFEESLAAQRQALALKETYLGSEHVDSAISMVNVGEALHELGRDDEAEPVLARARDVFARLMGGDSSLVAVVLLNHAEVLTAVGKFAAARADLERAVEIWTADKASPFYMGCALLDRGLLALAERGAAAARPLLQEAVTVLEKYDAGKTAEAEFALARAEPPSARAHAIELARKARAAMSDDPARARRVAEIDRWLGDQPASARR